MPVLLDQDDTVNDISKEAVGSAPTLRAGAWPRSAGVFLSRPLYARRTASALGKLGWQQATWSYARISGRTHHSGLETVGVGGLFPDYFGFWRLEYLVGTIVARGR